MYILLCYMFMCFLVSYELYMLHAAMNIMIQTIVSTITILFNVHPLHSLICIIPDICSIYVM